jgi:2Fe-2S iron-sulfur cluster binding domain
MRMSRGPAQAPAVTIEVNGQAVAARPGSSLSAALWNAGWRAFSAHPVTGDPRGPLCGMGVCQECVVWVSEGAESIVTGGLSGVGEPGPDRPRLVRSCLEPVRAGMRVHLGPAGAESNETS